MKSENITVYYCTLVNQHFSSFLLLWYSTQKSYFDMVGKDHCSQYSGINVQNVVL